MKRFKAEVRNKRADAGKRKPEALNRVFYNFSPLISYFNYRYIIPALILKLAVFYAILAFSGLTRMTGSDALWVSSTGGRMPVIIIDPGHGGMDGGAVGVDSVVEKNINLEIAFILRDLFIINGFEVVMTREEDVSIHDPGVIGIRAQKTSDLHNRLAFTNRFSDSIFISIHQNKFGDPAQKGAQVFYGPNNPGSELLAEAVQRNVASMIQPENRRRHKESGSNLFIIYRAANPAILVEGGFLSNPQDAKNLTDAKYQAQLAFAIFRSTLEYLGMELPVSFA